MNSTRILVCVFVFLSSALLVELALKSIDLSLLSQSRASGASKWESFRKLKLDERASEESPASDDQGSVDNVGHGQSSNSQAPSPSALPDSRHVPEEGADSVAVDTSAKYAENTAVAPKFDALRESYKFVRCPQARSRGNNRWSWYLCDMEIASVPQLSPYGVDMPLSFMTPAANRFSPEQPARLMVYLHPDEGGSGRFVTGPSSFSFREDAIEIHAQEERYGKNPGGSWWGLSGAQAGAVANYNGRRLVAAIDYVRSRFGAAVDLEKGIHLKGKSLGGAGVMHQPFILPAYAENIAIVDSVIGHMMAPKCCRKMMTRAWGSDQFDSVDIRMQWPKVSHIHFFWRGGSNDGLGRFDIDFFDLCEREKISCSGYWLRGGHSATEKGYKLNRSLFTDPNQDVTLDKPLPVISGSTANHHGEQRGYHNRGITWNYAGLSDSHDSVEIPLQYIAMRNIGPGLPDQPESVSFSVTPRNLKYFELKEGQNVSWTFGHQSGVSRVAPNGLVTIDGLVLQTHSGYQILVLERTP
jgi:hypothetical protein